MIHEECGVMGAYDFDGGDVALDLYHGLYTLQHRGQESCGIVTNDYVKLYTVKGKGLVNEVFTKYNLPTLKGKIGVGHVLYGRGERRRSTHSVALLQGVDDHLHERHYY